MKSQHSSEVHMQCGQFYPLPQRSNCGKTLRNRGVYNFILGLKKLLWKNLVKAQYVNEENDDDDGDITALPKGRM